MRVASTIAIGSLLLTTMLGSLYWVKYEAWVAIPRAHTAINNQLKDPLSTQFRNERLTKDGVLCGELNSKNSNGGYIGFKKYVSLGPQANYLEGEGSVGEWSTSDMNARLDRKIKLLEAWQAIHEKNPKILIPSNSHVDKLAIADFFDEKWRQLCPEN